MKIPVNPVALVVGLLVVAAGVGSVLYMLRGEHIDLKGSVLKVRTQAMDEKSSVAIIDFRFVNPADYPFVVKEVIVSIEDKDGKTWEGQPVSELDARRLFEYYPQLGQKFNESLMMRDKIMGRQSMDRMIATRFEVPEATVESRKKLTIRIVDVDGPVAELRENR